MLTIVSALIDARIVNCIGYGTIDCKLTLYSASNIQTIIEHIVNGHF